MLSDTENWNEKAPEDAYIVNSPDLCNIFWEVPVL